MSEIRTTAVISRAPAEVYDYVTTPGHWPEWHPSSVRVSGVTERSMNVGETCTEEYVVAGRRGSCVWTTRERLPDRRWVIDTVTKGGRARVAYLLEPLGGETRFERVLTYQMPNFVLSLVDALILRRRIRRESEEATRRLKERLEASGGSAAFSP